MPTSVTPSSIPGTDPIIAAETISEGSTVSPESKTTSKKMKTADEIVETLNKTGTSENKRDASTSDLVKNHPLYAPWRDMESMQFPEKKQKIKKLKTSLFDKNTSDKDRSGDSEEKNEKQAEKDLKKNEKQAEKDLKKNEKQAEKDLKKNEKKAAKEKKKEERAKKKAERKERRIAKRKAFFEKVTLNPFSRVRYGGKETLKTVVSFPANIIAKAAHIVGRPQSLFVGEMWSDLAKNLGKGFVNFFRTIAGTVYKPYRTKLPYENIFKDYGASFNPEGNKGLGALGLGLLWGFRSIPRIPAQFVEGVAHTLSETATGKFDYTHTADAFRKAFSIIHDKPATNPVESLPKDAPKT